MHSSQEIYTLKNYAFARCLKMAEAFVLVRVGSSDRLNFMQTVKEEICKVKGVKEIQGVFGRYDFVIRVEAKTLPELGNLITDCIRSIKGVVNTETLLVGF
jgi:DNA-binding Lrp family transcriptional regulator